MTRPWTMGEWSMEQDRYAKRLAFGPGIGWIDNDDPEESEQREWNGELIKLTALMAEVILDEEVYVSSVSGGGERYTEVSDRLHEIIARAEATKPFDHNAWLEDNAPARCSEHKGERTGWAIAGWMQGFDYSCGCFWGSNDGRGEGWSR